MPPYLVAAVLAQPVEENKKMNFSHRATILEAPSVEAIRSFVQTDWCEPGWKVASFEANELKHIHGFVRTLERPWSPEKADTFLEELAKLPKDAADRILDLATSEARLVAR